MQLFNKVQAAVEHEMLSACKSLPVAVSYIKHSEWNWPKPVFFIRIRENIWPFGSAVFSKSWASGKWQYSETPFVAFFDY